MRHFWKTLLGTTCAVLLFGLAASADTLQLKNGDVVQGKYLGGGEHAVQFEVNGKTELYETSRILSITFTGERSAENVPAVPADRYERVASAESDRGRPSLPAGTHVMVRMIDSVDSQTNHVGDRFRASLESDLMADDVVIASKGTDVYGRLAQADEAGHLSGKAQLKLELTDILIHDQMQPIVTGDYDVAGKGRGENTAEKTVGGAAIARDHRRHCRRREAGARPLERRRRRRRGRGGERGDPRRTSARAQRDGA